MSERRQAERHVITAVAEVSVIENNFSQEGYVINISETGVGVFMKHPLKLNSTVEIKMSFYTNTGIKDVEKIRGKVKRVAPFNSVYNIGIQFDKLDPKKDHDLISYLKSAKKQL
jgi:hypothetical protein